MLIARGLRATVARQKQCRQLMSTCGTCSVRRRAGAQVAAAAAAATTAAASRCTGRLNRAQQQLRRSGTQAVCAAAAKSGPMAGEVCSLDCRLMDVPGAAAEELAEVLLAYGAQSTAVEEYRPQGGAEQEIYADEHADGRVWDRCTVVAYFPPELDGGAILAETAANFGLSDRQRSVEEVRTQDWEQSIRDSYQPAQVADGLWIVPIWSEPTDPAATNIILEPGLAFGTGDHPTTRLCLRWLQSLQKSGSLAGAAVMDYGAGSGVLAVAALLLGASRAVGTDVEPLAVKSTVANAQLNGVSDRLASYQCAASLDEEEPLAAAQVPAEQRLFEVTVANILQGPLVGLAPRLAAYTKPGGLLGLSGILNEQTAAVIEAYSPWFEGFSVASEDRWALVTATRRQAQPQPGAEVQQGQVEPAPTSAGNLEEQTLAQAYREMQRELVEIKAQLGKVQGQVAAQGAAASASVTASQENAARAEAPAAAVITASQKDATKAKAAAEAAAEDLAAADRVAAAVERAEAADGPAQELLAAQALAFVPGHSLEVLRGQPDGLLQKARELLHFIDPTTITQATLLEAPLDLEQAAPLAITFSSVRAKATALAAARKAREASGPGGAVRIAVRLTRWQQERRTALQPQLEQLKADGQVVRMWRGHVLQKETSNGWVTVPLEAAA